MKHHYTTKTLQTAIDAACQETHAKYRIEIGSNLVLDINAMPEAWQSEAPARLHLARELLDRLPEPPIPTVDGKTPGQVAYACWYSDWQESPCKDQWERAASVVLAAFGNSSLSAAIARMEAVPINELWKIHERSSNSLLPVRARLISAAKEGQTVVDSWQVRAENAAKAAAEQAERAAHFEARAEKDEAELARVITAAHEAGWNGVENSKDLAQFIKNLAADIERMTLERNHAVNTEKLAHRNAKLSQLRPLSEAGDVPEGCVRVFSQLCHDRRWYFGHYQQPNDTHFADIRLPEPQTPEVVHDGGEVFEVAKPEALGQHGPAGMPPLRGPGLILEPVVSINTKDCELMDEQTGEALAAMIKAASTSQPEEIPWTPAIGDIVRLKSGGDMLTVTEYDAENKQWRCVGLTGGCPCYLCVPLACLEPAMKEDAR